MDNDEKVTDSKLRDIKETLANLNNEYNNLPDSIKNDRVLDGTLTGLFDKISKEISFFITKNKKEEKPKDKVEESKKEEIKNDSTITNDKTEDDIDAEYEVVSTRDGSNIYKKFGKHVLLSSAIATIALLIPSTTSFVIPAIIVANGILLAKEPVMNKINNILGKSVGAKKGKDGKW